MHKCGCFKACRNLALVSGPADDAHVSYVNVVTRGTALTHLSEKYSSNGFCQSVER